MPDTLSMRVTDREAVGSSLKDAVRLAGFEVKCTNWGRCSVLR